MLVRLRLPHTLHSAGLSTEPFDQKALSWAGNCDHTSRGASLNACHLLLKWAVFRALLYINDRAGFLVHNLAAGSHSLTEVCWAFAVPSARLNKWPVSIVWSLGNLTKDNLFFYVPTAYSSCSPPYEKAIRVWTGITNAKDQRHQANASQQVTFQLLIEFSVYK